MYDISLLKVPGTLYVTGIKRGIQKKNKVSAFKEFAHLDEKKSETYSELHFNLSQPYS